MPLLFIMLPTMRRIVGSNLDQAATKVQQLGPAQRKARVVEYGADFEGCFYHERYESFVTYRSFGRPDDPQTGQLAWRVGGKARMFRGEQKWQRKCSTCHGISQLDEFLTRHVRIEPRRCHCFRPLAQRSERVLWQSPSVWIRVDVRILPGG